MVNFNIESLVQNTTVGFNPNVEKAFLSYHGHDDGTKAEIVQIESSPLEESLYGAKTEGHTGDLRCCCGQRFEVAPNGEMIEFNEIEDKQSILVLGDQPKQDDSKYKISHQKGLYSLPTTNYSGTITY